MPTEGQNFLENITHTDPAVEAARERAQELIQRASLDESIRVLEELEEEVENMQIREGFSRTLKIGDNPALSQTRLPYLKELPEAKHKRTQLLRDISEIKNRIIASIAAMEMVVLDIEATKTKG